MNYKPTHIQGVTFADLNPKLEAMKADTLSGGWWQTITLAQRLLEQQEMRVNELTDQRTDLLHMVRRSGPTYKATYIGPLSAWQGKTALLRDMTVAQFDDLGQYMAYGWHGVKKSDFRIEPKATLAEALATICESRMNCQERLEHNDIGAREWFDKWTDRAEDLVREHMPRGSGFDAGTNLELDESGASRLVFNTSFHHMDENGGYDGWTEHQVIVTPSLSRGFDLRVTGRNKNEIKEYISEVFSVVLNLEVNKYGDDK